MENSEDRNARGGALLEIEGREGEMEVGVVYLYFSIFRWLVGVVTLQTVEKGETLLWHRSWRGDSGEREEGEGNLLVVGSFIRGGEVRV